MRRFARWTGRVGLALVILGLAAWGALALWFRAPLGESLRPLLPGAWGAISLLALASLVASRRTRVTGPVYSAALLALFGWWFTLQPRADRDWAPDVSRPATATLQGNLLTVHDVRNFRWRSDTDFDAAWEDRTYDLDRITGADLFLSYWAGEEIAHAIVSFGFEDGQPLAWSFEVRKVKGEEYSALAGFFRHNELVAIAADERDVVKVRTAVRGEDVRIYRLDIRKETARRLLLSYVARANELAARPAFYNTLLTNCTTVIFGMAKAMDPGITLDYRVLLSGLLPGYLYDNDFLTRAVPLDALVEASHIRARAATVKDDADFSATIRRDVPAPAPQP